AAGGPARLLLVAARTRHAELSSRAAVERTALIEQSPFTAGSAARGNFRAPAAHRAARGGCRVVGRRGARGGREHSGSDRKEGDAARRGVVTEAHVGDPGFDGGRWLLK